MILQPIHHQLTPNNCAVILVDYQSQLALTIGSTDEETLIHNAINLAKIAKTFNIPTVLTTIGKRVLVALSFQNFRKSSLTRSPLAAPPLAFLRTPRFSPPWRR